MDASTGLAPHSHAEHDPHHHDAGHDHHELPFWRKYIISTDHKVIGIQFLFSGLIFFVVGGLLALAIRWQLAWPWSPVPVLSQWLWSEQGYRMPPEFYNKLFTMHGSVMIFFISQSSRKAPVNPISGEKNSALPIFVTCDQSMPEVSEPGCIH